MPNQVGSDALHNELREARTRSKLLPRLSTILGRASLVVGTGLVGFEIGTALRSIWVNAEVPSSATQAGPSAPAVTGARFFEQGELVKPISQFEGYILAPYQGWAGTYNTAGTVGFTSSVTTDTAWFAKQERAPWQQQKWQTVGPDGVSRTSWYGFYYFKSMKAPIVDDVLAPGYVAQGARREWPGSGQGTTQTPAQVSDALQAELAANESMYRNLLAWLDAQMGGDSTDPTASTVTVPSCAGDLYAQCAAKLQAAELVPARSTVTFPQTDLEKPADAVLTLNPAGGAAVDTGTSVTVTTNPPPSEYPRMVPSPAAGETYSAYIARLQSLDLVGSVTVLSEANTDTSKGPDEVVRVRPVPGSAVAPGSTVTIEANPSTAPAAGGPTPGPWGVPAIPSLNLEPLSQVTPCTVFPFGVPCWIVGALGGFGGSSNCPSWAFPETSFGGSFPIDLCILNPAVAIFRPLALVVAMFGLAWLFMGAAMGFGGKGGDD
jgi:hypothetical protein